MLFRSQTVHENDFDKEAAAGGFPKFPDTYASALAQCRLTLNKGRVTTRLSAATGGILRGAGSACLGHCYLIELGREPSEHTVAMQDPGFGVEGWRFFDANYGCFRLKTDAIFEDFFDEYMRWTYYEEQFGWGVEIVGVNPPPYVLSGFGPRLKNQNKVRLNLSAM